MRELSIVIAFLALLLTECAACTATESTQPQETTVDIATGSTQPETTLGSAVVLEERTETTTEAAPPPKTRTPATVAPADQVTAIGASVMKGAVGTLQQKIPNLRDCLKTSKSDTPSILFTDPRPQEGPLSPLPPVHERPVRGP